MLRIEQQTHAARAAWRTQVTPQNWRAQIIMRKTNFRKSPKIAELEGRVGGDNKYPETKGTKNYARNKTSAKSPKQKSPSWRGKLEGTINTPSEGTNNYAWTETFKKRQYYVRNKTSEISKKIAELEGTKIPHLLHNFSTLSSMQRWTLGKGVMILAYLGQTPEVPRTDLRAKHHS